MQCTEAVRLPREQRILHSPIKSGVDDISSFIIVLSFAFIIGKPMDTASKNSTKRITA